MTKFTDIKSAQYLYKDKISVFLVFIITNAMGSLLKNLFIAFPLIIKKENVNSF